MNSVILVGRLTADPELRQTQSGVSACNFTVAVDRKFADKNTGERQADFIRCQAWRQTADFIGKYFSKGKMIGITGSLRTGSYTDRNHSDVTHYTTDVYVDNVEFVGGKNDSTGVGAGVPDSPQTAQNSLPDSVLADFEEVLSDGDVPF